MPIKRLYSLSHGAKVWFPTEGPGPLSPEGSGFSSVLSTLLDSSSFLLGEWHFSQDYQGAGGSAKLSALLPHSFPLTPLQRAFPCLWMGKRPRELRRGSELWSAALACPDGQMRKEMYRLKVLSQVFRYSFWWQWPCPAFWGNCAPRAWDMVGFVKWLTSCEPPPPPRPTEALVAQFSWFLIILSSFKNVLRPLFYYCILVPSLGPCGFISWLLSSPSY